MGFLKLNVDGVIFFNLEKTDIGTIIQDGKRKSLFAASVVESNIELPESIEALTILRDLRLNVKLGCHKHYSGKQL